MDKRILKIIVAVLASAYFFYYAATPYTWHFIDNANLLIHEAGHWIFWPFGDFMHILGGSLNQVLVPLLFVGYFYFEKEYYSAAITLFWVGQNLINVSVYAGDAVKMQLPLLGGDNVIHDWNWLLFDLGQLHHTAVIAGTIRTLGIVVLIIATIWAITAAFSNKKIVNYE